MLIRGDLPHTGGNRLCSTTAQEAQGQLSLHGRTGPQYHGIQHKELRSLSPQLVGIPAFVFANQGQASKCMVLHIRLDTLGGCSGGGNPC